VAVTGESAFTISARVDPAHVGLDRGDVRGGGGVELVDDDQVGQAEMRLARVVAQLVARPVRIGHHDVEVRPDEREVVVAAVPEDHARLLLGAVEDPLVVHSGEDHVAPGDVGLVLLALLDGAVLIVHVAHAREALAHLPARSPYGTGWRTTATRTPSSPRICATRRAVWLLPQPVRTAPTAITGRPLRNMVWSIPRSTNSAPAAFTRDAARMTCS